MKYLNKILFTLVGLLLLFSSVDAFAEAGGDLNLTNKASLSSRTGYNLNLSTQGSSDSIDFIVAGTSKGKVTSSGLTGLTLSSPTILGNLLPSADNTYDLGSAAFEWRSAYIGTDLVFGASAPLIRQDTADAADSKKIELVGGGATGITRGGSIAVYGNEQANTGGILALTGDAAGSSFFTNLGSATSTWAVRNSSGGNFWSISAADGTLNQSATNGGSIVLSKASTAVVLPLATGLTATGTTFSNAYALGYQYNDFSTVAAGTGARLWDAPVGTMVTVTNRGANALLVYPSTGHTINAGGTNASVSITNAGATGIFIKVTPASWIGSEAPAA